MLSETMFKTCWKSITYLLLLIFGSSGIVVSQNSNQRCVDSLIVEGLQGLHRPVGKLDGYAVNRILNSVRSGIRPGLDVVVDIPSVRFSKVKPGRFLRSVDVCLDTFSEDFGPGRFCLNHQDTLSGRQLKLVRKNCDSESKGESPRGFVKHGIPVFGLGSGVAGIIALFYTRSKSK